ncbi:hypothetical protein C9374_004356 [Naegleria lovaniensis]|uniref:SGNH hydrolase-type esterase domain-containing protein n=1 Tax=Naegleria lovaniensis TaxID=51637 RepID=A0AA88GT75_NAELO|nr:uncharacterized protein C9374_004356 [Naegleria lovaniensis]KAG2383685.1 hypothetical protein C9374_004356 [Naegleria lovaniensis]
MQEQGPINILALGASITAGYYNNGLEYHPYSIKLSSLLSNFNNKQALYHVEPFGVNGERTDQMKLRLGQILNYYLPGTYQGIIIIGGTNDLPACTSDVTIGNLISMYEQGLMNDHFKFVVACSIPSSALDLKSQTENSVLMKEYSKKKSEVNYAIREYVEKSRNSKLIFVDLMEELNYCKCTDEERNRYWDDPLHFTPEGYDRIADILFEKLKNFL